MSTKRNAGEASAEGRRLRDEKKREEEKEIREEGIGSSGRVREIRSSGIMEFLSSSSSLKARQGGPESLFPPRIVDRENKTGSTARRTLDFNQR